MGHSLIFCVNISDFKGHFQMECDQWCMAPSNPNHCPRRFSLDRFHCNSWKSYCAVNFNMGWQILVFNPKQ